MLTRICPTCNATITYATRATYVRGVQIKSECRSCRAKLPVKRTNFIRNCPECNKEIEYKFRVVNGQLSCGNYYTARKKNSLCKSCSQTGERHKYFGKTLPDHVKLLKKKDGWEKTIPTTEEYRTPTDKISAQPCGTATTLSDALS